MIETQPAILTREERTDVIKSVMRAADEIMKNVSVVYAEVVSQKTIIASFYLENNVTKSKFLIATGVANTFFEENHNPSIGNEAAYADGLPKARKFIEEALFFQKFCHPNIDVFPVTINNLKKEDNNG